MNSHTLFPSIAIILAGGKGTRLRPITYETPKPLIPIHGRPLIFHILDLFRKYKINNVLLSVGYMKDKIKKRLGNGSKFGLNIVYLEEDEPLGTGGPLKLAKKYLTKTFIVSNGDELKKINITEMFNFHRQNKALATIALTKVDNPSAYGVAELDGKRIAKFIEKPKIEDAPSNLINAGFYIMEPEMLSYIPNGFCMLERDVFPKIAEEGKLFAFPFSGQWFDTGNIERYEKAKNEWTDIKL